MFTILCKALTRHLSPLGIGALVSGCGLLMIAPLALGEARAMRMMDMAPADWLALAWWAAASGVGYFWLWCAGLARVEVQAAGLVTVVLPLSTLVLSSLFLHEVITIHHLAGATCTFAAVLIVSGASLRVWRKPPARMVPSLPVRTPRPTQE